MDHEALLAKVDALLEGLEPAELEALARPISEELVQSVVPIDVPWFEAVVVVEGDAPVGATTTLWLTVNQHRRCYYFYAKYDYEAFVTKDSKNGPRYAVDRIDLRIDRDPDSAHYTHSCANTSYCNKTDKVYATGGACGTSCVRATATHKGNSWSTQTSCV